MVGTAKLFYYGRVIDNQDIFGLNRVRVFPETEDTIKEILKKTKKELLNNIENPTDIIDEAKYTINDPFVFYPLLPPYLSFIPKVNELVWITYSMLGDKQQRKEQFYIPGPKTSPFNISFDVHKVIHDYISKSLYHTTRHFIKTKVGNNVNIVNNRIKLI